MLHVPLRPARRSAACSWRAACSSATARTSSSTCTRRLTARARRSWPAPASRCGRCWRGAGRRRGRVQLRRPVGAAATRSALGGRCWQRGAMPVVLPPFGRASSPPARLLHTHGRTHIAPPQADRHHQARHRPRLLLQGHPQRHPRGRPAPPRAVCGCAPRALRALRALRTPGRAAARGTAVLGAARRPLRPAAAAAPVHRAVLPCIEGRAALAATHAPAQPSARGLPRPCREAAQAGAGRLQAL